MEVRDDAQGTVRLMQFLEHRWSKIAVISLLLRSHVVIYVHRNLNVQRRLVLISSSA